MISKKQLKSNPYEDNPTGVLTYKNPHTHSDVIFQICDFRQVLTE